MPPNRVDPHITFAVLLIIIALHVLAALACRYRRRLYAIMCLWNEMKAEAFRFRDIRRMWK